MSSSKKLTCKGTLLRVSIRLRPRTPSPPPPHIIHCIRVYTIQYTYSHRERGKGGEITREKVRGATLHKAGSKIPT
jgi:hypothetical protein